jgi:hypothetical protein
MTQADSVHSTPPTNSPITHSRRGFLSRTMMALAAGAAVNATAGIATRPAASAAIVEDHPAIIALGERIEPLLAAYRTAAEDRLKARADAEASCPAVPEELVSEGTFFAGCTASECDVEGKKILQNVLCGDGKKYALPREILNSERTKATIARGNLYCNRRTKFGKKLGKMIDTAERYEAERGAAIEQSGLPDAMRRQWETAYEIEKLAYEACDIEPQTMAGVLVQARVLAAYAEAETEIGHYRGRAGQLVGPALAQSLMRLANARSV